MRGRMDAVCLAVMVASLGLAACPAEQESEGRTAQSQQASEQEAEATTTPASEEETAATPTPAATALEDLPVIASTPGAVAGTRTRLDINSLEVGDDGLATLNLTLTVLELDDDFFNHHGAFRDPNSESVADDFSGVYLVDEVNKKKYLPVLDSAGVCLCSQYVSFNGVATFYATFAAPEEGIEAVNVSVPNFPVLRNVPVSR